MDFLKEPNLRKAFIVAAAFFLGLSCQIARAGIVSFGFKGGLNFANISVSPKPIDIAEFNRLQGVTAGVFFSVNLGSFGIQPEFMYARRGTQYDYYDEPETYTAEWRFDYWEAILLIKWRIIPAGPARPIIFAGPSYGILSKAKAVIIDSSGAGAGFVDVKDDFKSGELGAVFGAGAEFKILSLRFVLEGRYHLGISNIAETGYEVDHIKNKGFSIMAGIAF
jgi:hypothetical protein